MQTGTHHEDLSLLTVLVFFLFFSWCLPPCQATFLFSLIKYTPLTYNKKYVYPWWGDTLGWLLALSSMVCIPLWIVYKLSTIKGPLRQVRLVLWDQGMGCASVFNSSPAVESFVCCRLISKEPRINELNELIAITDLVFKVLPCWRAAPSWLLPHGTLFSFLWSLGKYHQEKVIRWRR